MSFGAFTRSLGAGAAAVLGALALLAPASADAESPGLEALAEFRQGSSAAPPVQNRFFVKDKRFELAPMMGFVPNNPFSTRYTGSAIFGYHFNDRVSAQGMLSYSPDRGIGDLKGLTIALLRIASGSEDVEFRQPLDKVTLAANFGVGYSPFYGKLNLVGATVVNFDVYGTAGLAMLSKITYFATYDDSVPDGVPPVNLAEYAPVNEVEVAPVFGVGTNVFVNQTVAFKLDVRSALYVGPEPCYNPDDCPTQQRLYNQLLTSMGVGFYFPKMKPRLENF